MYLRPLFRNFIKNKLCCTLNTCNLCLHFKTIYPAGIILPPMKHRWKWNILVVGLFVKSLKSLDTNSSMSSVSNLNIAHVYVFLRIKFLLLAFAHMRSRGGELQCRLWWIQNKLRRGKNGIFTISYEFGIYTERDGWLPGNAAGEKPLLWWLRNGSWDRWWQRE